MKNTIKVRQTHKDRLFCNLFSKKENALSLYNALNGTDYKNENELEIVTLEDALYLTMKNDVAICLCGNICLWEQQSSVNPNMPLRGLLYFAREYEGWLASRKKDIYRRKLLKIPAPQFYVFYNGKEIRPEREEYHLADAFEHPVKGYDWTAHVININPDNNVSLLKNCSVLAGYTELIHQIRTRKQSGCTIETAVHQAVKHCIENDILKTYLLKNEGEVMSMILTEYDEELHNETLREEGMEKGIEKGIENGLHFAKMIFTLHKSGKSDIEIADTVGISLDKVKNLLY